MFARQQERVEKYIALGQEEGGLASRIDTVSEAGGDRRLELDLRVGLGQVRVER